MKKFYIIMIAVVTVSLLCFAGCNPDTTPTQAPTAAPTAQTSAATATPAPETNMKAGDVYRILVWDTAEENAPLLGDSESSLTLRQRVDGIQEEYGVTITYIQSPGYNWLDDAKASANAGEPIADLVHAGQPGALPGLYAYNGMQGTILSSITANGMDSYFADEQFWLTDTQEATGRYNGNLYFVVPQEIGFAGVGFNQVTFLNFELMEQAGYSKAQLYEMSTQGNWTFEALRQACIDANDPDKGIYGMTQGASSIAMCSMVVANGGNFLKKENGIDRYNGTDAKVLKAVDFYVSMAAVDKTVYSGNYVEEEAAGFITGNYAIMLTYANRIPAVYRMEQEFGVIMPPKGPDATDYISEVNWFNPWCFMANSDNTKGVMEMASKLLSPQYAVDSEENLQKLRADATVYLKDTESVQTLIDVREKSMPTTYQTYCWLGNSATNFGFGNAILYCCQQFIDGTTTPDVYFESVTNAANELIDTYFAVKE